MDSVSLEELQTLVESTQEPCVSLYLPTEKAGTGTQQNPIRLKNALVRAEERLVASGLRAPVARKLLEPAQNLLLDSFFWQEQGDGLALFVNPDLFRTYRLPLEFKDLLVTGERFHVKPLLPLFSGDGRFYVLAISQGGNRLLQGTRHSVQEIALEGAPKNLEEALQFDEFQEHIDFHTMTAAPGTGMRSAMFYGQGIDEGEAQKNILQYFQQVNRALRDTLRDEHAPLVFAGVEFLMPIYKEANTYPYLLDEAIEGSPDRLRADELHRRAWEIVEPYFQQDREKAAARYNERAGTGLASSDIREVVPAAHYGRVELLFVPGDREQWGTFDPQTNTVELHDAPQHGDEDLLDSAAVRTLLNGGSVYVVPQEQVPGDGPVAAVFRY